MMSLRLGASHGRKLAVESYLPKIERSPLSIREETLSRKQSDLSLHEIDSLNELPSLRN